MTDLLDHSGVRHWTDLLARLRFGTQEVNGRKITSSAIKAVANRLASYADYRTGGRVRPGVARLAVDLEVDPKTVKAALAVLRRCDLLRLVAPGGRGDSAAQYQLVIPTDLMERTDVELLSPAAQELEIERKRGRSGRLFGGPGGARGEPVDNDARDGCSEAPAGPAVDDPLQDFGGPVDPPEEPFGGPVDPISEAPPGPSTTHAPTTTEITQPIADLDTACTATGAREAVQDPIPIGQGKCVVPGCAKGWLVAGEAFARCRCNPASAEPAPDPPPSGGGQPPTHPHADAALEPLPDPVTVGAGPQLRVLQGGLAA